MNSIFTRRSVRQFTNEKVSEKDIELLLRAAMQAPSAANQQPWEFIIVEGKDNLSKLSEYNIYAGCLKNATLGIVLVANKDRFVIKEDYPQDMGACTQNILLQATELNLGAVWLGCNGHKDKMDKLSNILNLSSNIIPYAVIALGHPLNEDANNFKDRFDSSRITYIK